MRADSVKRTNTGGAIILVVLGAALAALAVGLLAANRIDESASTVPAAYDVDPAATTNGVIAFWEPRLASDPLDFTAANKLAQAYLQRARETGDVSDYSRAEAAVRASLAALAVDNPTALALLAGIQSTQHDFVAAETTAGQAIALGPGDPYAYGILGDAQLALGRYDDAARTYSELVAMSPGLTSFSREAHLLEIRGDIAGARAAWENAFATDGGRRPENTAWARTQYAAFLFGQGDLDAAGRQYDAALAVYPGYVHAVAGLARLAAAEGDYPRSLALYEDVVGRQPIPEYVAALGDVYAEDGRIAEAQDQYELVGAIDRLYGANGINTDLATALFLADHGIRLNDAVLQAQAAYHEAPGVYAADALAWALHRSGRSAEALPYIEEALSQGTRDAAFQYHAGEIYLASGNADKARFHFETSSSINPNFSPLHAGKAEAVLTVLDGHVE